MSLSRPNSAAFIVGKLAMFLPVFGMAFLATACGSSSSVASSNSSAGSGGLSGSGGAPGAAGTGGAAGAPVCPDFLGVPVAGPGPGGGCQDGACFGCITPIEAMSFALGMFGVTDDSGVTTANMRTEPGSVCMSGQSVGWATLNFALGRRDTPFDATALGITQLEFTVDTPPTSGVSAALVVLLPDLSPALIAWMSGGQPVSITGATTTKVTPFSDYTDPNYVLDPSRLITVAFAVGTAEHYDFCVRDLKFLDENGVEVLPTP